MQVEMPKDLRLRKIMKLENEEISEKSLNFINLCLVLSPPLKMKTLSVLMKISRKTEIHLFPKCAISHKN